MTWTIQDAKRAGLLGNPTWQKYPKQMLSNRVISEGIRRTYPGVLSGCYTPEEITDMNLPVIIETVQTTQLEAPKVMQIEAPKEEPLPEKIERINPMERLLAEKSQAQRDKVTAGAIKKGWIKPEGESYKDIPADIAVQATAFPERFFAAFGI